MPTSIPTGLNSLRHNRKALGRAVNDSYYTHRPRPTRKVKHPLGARFSRTCDQSDFV